MQKLRTSKGFTLVEMAIVLIIIGIILAAVLKGGDLIDGAKEKRFKSEVDQLTTAYYSYIDRFNRVPGDDDTALARWAGASNGGNNGLIDAAAERANDTGALNHLRRANMIPAGAAAAAPFNSQVYPGVSMTFLSSNDVAWARNTNLVVINGMAQADALLFDTKYDDGVANTGDIRSSDNAGVPQNAYANPPIIAVRLR